MRCYISASANFHCFIWASETPSQTPTYAGGHLTLHPQYFERPDDRSEGDRMRYFDPVTLTDASGQASEWVRRYIPAIGMLNRRTVYSTH
jgi:hopanoid C-2 methylase